MKNFEFLLVLLHVLLVLFFTPLIILFSGMFSSLYILELKRVIVNSFSELDLHMSELSIDLIFGLLAIRLEISVERLIKFGETTDL